MSDEKIQDGFLDCATKVWREGCPWENPRGLPKVYRIGIRTNDMDPDEAKVYSTQALSEAEAVKKVLLYVVEHERVSGQVTAVIVSDNRRLINDWVREVK